MSICRHEGQAARPPSDSRRHVECKGLHGIRRRGGCSCAGVPSPSLGSRKVLPVVEWLDTPHSRCRGGASRHDVARRDADTHGMSDAGSQAACSCTSAWGRVAFMLHMKASLAEHGCCWIGTARPKPWPRAGLPGAYDCGLGGVQAIHLWGRSGSLWPHIGPVLCRALLGLGSVLLQSMARRSLSAREARSTSSSAPWRSCRERPRVCRRWR